MSLPAYPAYKSSGVDWLGRIPDHWGISQSRRMFAVRSEPALQTDKVLTASQKYGVLYQSDFVALEGRRVVEVILGLENLKHVEPDDFIISMRSFQGGIEWCRLRGSTSFHYVMLRPVKNVWPPFFAHLLKSSVYIQALRRTTDLIRDGQELRFSNFAQVDLPVIPLEEQKSIAAFLDHETAKIDALIAEQEKLIALLAEKRQATISHAVTRGLDPDVPMKDSPLEWLGRIPAHWSIRRLKHVSPFITVGIVVNPSDYISEDGLPFIYGGDIGEGHIDVDRCRRISPSDSARQPKTQLQTGDLLTVRVGAPGVTAVVPEACEGGNCASVMLIRGGNFDSDWLCYAMNSRVVRYQVEVVQYGAAQEQFNIRHAVDFSVPTPPLHEQSKISRLLNGEMSRIDGLVFAAREAIALLKERRSALITAAVTGQIDVRGAAGAAQDQPQPTGAALAP